MGNVMEAPTPTADPFMAATTGFSERKIRRVSIPPRSRGATPPASPAGRTKVRAPEPRSAPAQKARPFPVTTTARTSSSVSVWSNTSRSSAPMAPVKALRRSGRLRVIVATPASTP